MSCYRIHSPEGSVRVHAQNKEWAKQVGITLLICKYPGLKVLEEDDFLIEEEGIKDKEELIYG